MRQAARERHRRVVHGRHLGGEHSLNLVARLDALDDREHEICPPLGERILLPTRIDEVAHQADVEVEVRCSDRPHQGEDSDCLVGMIGAECGRRSVPLHFQPRPACFISSFEFGERLFFPRGQLVRRLLGRESRAPAVRLCTGRPRRPRFSTVSPLFESSFNRGAQEALGRFARQPA